jgi:chaperone modulatory protein CbpM
MTTTVVGRWLPMRPARLSLGALAARVGLHPELLRRFVALGLLEPDVDTSGDLWFQPSDVQVVARIERLRVGLPVNYAAIGLIMDLLDEIDTLHAAAARSTSVWPTPNTSRS